MGFMDDVDACAGDRHARTSHLASHVCLNAKTHLPTSRDNWVRVWAESQRRGVYRSYEMVRFS